MNANRALSVEQQRIIPIAAYTAMGDLARLAPALAEGLDAGLSVNEIKEILVHLYAYAGFPRSLNGINAFMRVLKERKAQGITDEPGRGATPVAADLDRDAYGARVRAKLAGSETIPPAAGYQLFAPIIDTFLKEHLFADLFARDVLDFQSRELATISALASMTGTSGQLAFYLGAAMNVGLSRAQMEGFVAVLQAQVGQKEASEASAILSQVLASRGQ